MEITGISNDPLGVHAFVIHGDKMYSAEEWRAKQAADALNSRLDRIEAKLDRLLAELDPPN